MKMHLLKDCIKVELQGSTLPEAAIALEPFHFNRSRTIYYFSRHKLPEVLQIFGKDIDNLPDKVREAYELELDQREKVKTLKTHGPVQDPRVNEYLTLMPHQQLAREIAQICDKYAFYYDTRTGKTPLSISVILDDLKEHPDHKWLVVAPMVLLELAWAEDIRKFAPDVPTVVCHASTPAKRLALIQQEANIYILNTESFVKYIEHFDGVTRVILDESSSMKSNKSKFSKAFVEYARTCDRVYLLSGTPAPNGAWEYYKQIQAIDYYGIQQSFAQFKNKYFLNLTRDVRFDDLVLRPDMVDSLRSLIGQYAIYVDKEDVLKTPGRKFIEYTLDMPDKLKGMYKQMRQDLATEVETGVDILAPSAAAKLNKLNQITSGFIIDTEARHRNELAKKIGSLQEVEPEVYLLNDYRFRALQELLKELGDQQVIIWANYHVEFEYIERMLGKKCRTVYGKTPAASKVTNIQDFKQRKVQYLVANSASADKGLTLTNCHICIYFSLNWSYEEFRQSMERIYGDKSIQPYECLYYIFEAKSTVDPVIYRDVLVNKQEISFAILNHLKADNNV